MSCGIASEQQFLELKNQLSSTSSQDSSPKLSSDSKKIKLARGGWVVQTNVGNIQFGMVPDTVKDSLIQGLKVPTHYIVPTVRFNKKYCISVCEFEFPAYFNFFVLKTKINLICTKEEEVAIRKTFQETLLGPPQEYLAEFIEDFDNQFDKELIPNIQAELNYFAKNPFNPSEPLTIDLLLNFTILDQNNEALLSESVKVKKQDNKIFIYQDGEILVEGKDHVSVRIQQNNKEEQKVIEPQEQQNQEEKNNMVYSSSFIQSNFVPPAFGITILGCSHGFDPSGSTSGYIIWSNGRGIMIDPPAYSTQLLKKMGIPSFLIGWIIISHTHADHDSGAFQKILESQKVEIITTKTVMNSFVRKYSAISNITQDDIRALFTFRPAIIGSNCKINGADFEFFYSLHAIPCIGFIARYGGKSIYFSGDTFYDPEKMKERFLNSGIMSQKRYDQLTSIDYKFNHTLVLHEAGVPPIHTPMVVLAALPDEVKEKLQLVHVAPKDIPNDKGLKPAKTGIENTQVLQDHYNQDLRVDSAILKRLDLLSNIPIFSKANLKHIRDLIECIIYREYKAGQQIVAEGTFGDEFYIVEQGIIKISSKTKGIELYHYIGDYFGEASLYKGQTRMADVHAVTDCHILVLKRNDFCFIFGDQQESSVLKDLKDLLESRQQISIGPVGKNKLFAQMTTSQKIQFEIILKYCKLSAGSYLWKKGDQNQFAFLLASGILEFQDCDEATSLLQIMEGNFIGEVHNMLTDKPMETNIKAQNDVIGFKIMKKDLILFLKNNPGIFLLVNEKNKIII